MDVLIAIVIFILSFIIIYSIANEKTDSGVHDFFQTAEIISDEANLDKSNLSVVSSGEINETKIRDLAEIEYEDLKDRLDINKDFCIYFEDEDGNLIQIDDGMGGTIGGVGSGDINVSDDISCS